MTIILVIVVIIVVILWITVSKKLKTTTEQLDSSLDNHVKVKNELNGKVAVLSEKNNELESKVIDLELKNEQLAKYQEIVDIESKAKEILLDAETKAKILTANADEIKNQASNDASLIKQNAVLVLDNATIEAKNVIEEANEKAEEIAGDAYNAMQNASEYTKTVKAMKNIIEGYGDQYLIPTYSLLDDLADEFGHTEAGEKLKKAREKTKFMILSRSAAKCDYVESNRKETAILFVTDAFNGKVDSILSKVKKDNYGTLEQKIKDARQIVNNLGVPFKNAVITQEYCDARIEELKWAVIAQELKWEEQEEQRRIKEQIREEEKAKREYEKAMKDAQKEEETLKRLIEKAQKEVAQANDEQKAIFDEKLKELELKLKTAEEKNQRALSMAQQTRSGNVYIISNIGSFGEDVYKIGMTRRLEPLDRVKELGDASVPFEFDVHAMIYSEDAPTFERALHKKFLRLQLNKVNPRKEFFKVSLSDIKDEIEKMNINAKWTMAAEARQYKESLAIEESIKQDKNKQLEWERHQLLADPVTVEADEDIG
jgi:hypothetical protein